VFDLLVYLRCCSGTMPHVALVGGAVRDYFAGLPVNDIDLVISGTWENLLRGLRAYLAVIDAADSTIVNTSMRRSFGALKILGSGSDREDLDLALFKTFPLDYPNRHDAHRENAQRYVYGFSYVTDARSRDFTCNTLYYDVFSRRFEDPTGTGKDDAKCSQGGMEANFSNPSRLHCDLGGCFRLWKLRLSETKYNCSHSTFDKANEVLSAQLDFFHSQVSAMKAKKEVVVSVGELDMELELTTYRYFMEKLMKKILKDPSRYDADIRALYHAFDGAAFEERNHYIWDSLARLCHQQLSFLKKHFPDVRGDNDVDMKVILLIRKFALRSLEGKSAQSKLPKSESEGRLVGSSGTWASSDGARYYAPISLILDKMLDNVRDREGKVPSKEDSAQTMRMKCGIEVVKIQCDIPELISDPLVELDCIISSENSYLRMGYGDSSISSYVAKRGGAIVQEELKAVGKNQPIIVDREKGTVLWTGSGDLASHGVRGIAHVIVIEGGRFYDGRTATYENVAFVFKEALRQCNSRGMRSVAVRYPFTSKSSQPLATLQNAMISVLESADLLKGKESRCLSRIYLCYKPS